MASVKTIVCAVDFSEGSPRVAEYAATLAKATGAQILCVYIAPSLAEYVGFNVPQAALDSFVGDVVSSADTTMHDFLSQHFKEISATGLVVTGYPAEEILNKLDDLKCDAIVMGTHSKGAITHTFLGSVAERILRRVRKPVFIFPAA